MLDSLLNFKVLLVYVLLLTFASCGVKGPPVQYTETIVDSYIHEYTKGELSPEESERIKNQQITPSKNDPPLIKP